MPIPSRQIGWSTQENLLWEISKQLEKASCQLCNIVGPAGTSGSSGLSGDRFRTTSTTEFTLGVSTNIVVEPGLAYTPAQDIIITYNTGNHQVCTVVSYDINTGAMVIGPPVTVVGGGTYSSWTVNLDGAAGGNGSSGSSGTSGVNGSSGRSGTSGSSGSTGTSGSSGTSGANGSSGTSGSSGVTGAAGTSGVSGTSGTSPSIPGSISYGLFAQTGNSTIITSTTVESSLINGGVGTLTVPANGFSIGDSFRAIFGGVLNVANNQTIRIRVKSNGVLLLDSGAQSITNITNNVYNLHIDFTIRALGGAGTASIVSLGAFNYVKTSNGAIEGFGFNVINNTTFNTTINNTLDVTVQWGSASAGNSIYSDIFILNKTY
jgi:hypothetical protein